MALTLERYLLTAIHEMLPQRGWIRLGTSRSVGERQTQYVRPVGETSAILWVNTVQMNWPDDQSVVLRLNFGNGSAAHTAVIENWEERSHRKDLFFAVTVPPEMRSAWPKPPKQTLIRGTSQIRCRNQAECNAVCEWLGQIESGFLIPWATTLRTHDLTADYCLAEAERMPPEFANFAEYERMRGMTGRSLTFTSQALALCIAGGDRQRATALADRLYQLTRSAPADSLNLQYYDRLIAMAPSGVVPES